jgi:hypothetical protein
LSPTRRLRIELEAAFEQATLFTRPHGAGNGESGS